MKFCPGCGHNLQAETEVPEAPPVEETFTDTLDQVIQLAKAVGRRANNGVVSIDLCAGLVKQAIGLLRTAIEMDEHEGEMRVRGTPKAGLLVRQSVAELKETLATMYS